MFGCGGGHTLPVEEPRDTREARSGGFEKGEARMLRGS